ncbi:MAG: glycoside hydrolase family 16 protein [Acidimicrobiia bacterium]|nr:glycoside hydrolase family 16 protein [Acidimicrobiia bacterium]
MNRQQSTVQSTRRAGGRRGPTTAAILAMIVVAAACGSADPGAEVVDSAESSEDVASTTETTTAIEETTTSVAEPPITAPITESIEIPEPAPIDEDPGWELVWSDEFDGDTIDTTAWTYDIGGWGWGNGEAQYYTDRPENARLENGLLVIEARQEQFEDSYYTSARLKTEGLKEFQYGRIEARIKVPAGAGLWPAFWMLGSGFEHGSDDPARSWPNVGEIDVMEYLGREPDLIMGTIHGPGYAGGGGLTRWNRQDYPIADEFHTYSVEWSPEGISWFYDGELYYTVTPEDLSGREWVFDKEFFLILNLAVGGQFPGPIDLNLEFPVFLFVDHVRVYQQAEG